MFNRLRKPTEAQPSTATVSAPSGLVSFTKSAAVSLEKRGLTGQRAAVYLVVDRSYSMKDYFKNGSVQHLADQVLGLSANLDDDSTVPLVMFDSHPYPVFEISLDQYQGVVADLHSNLGGELTMGGTQYTTAMATVIEHYRRSGATDPALVIFQTDGDPQDQDAARLQLATASRLPIFWSFLGFGRRKVAFLTQLDEMGGRLVDNASYFHAGADPKGLPDVTVYDGITGEFGRWLAAARAKNILP